MADKSWKFTYNIGRPYPFRWFTVCIIVEFLLAIVIFSLISVLTSGYELVSVYTSDPNNTETRKIIPGLPEAFESKFKPSCQSIEIDVGSSFSTNYSALTYTVSSVRQGANSSPSFVYHNNRLENCSVNDVLINVGYGDRSPTQQAIALYGVGIVSSVTCALPSVNGNIALNLSAFYNFVPLNVGSANRFFTFAGRDKVNSASFFRAENALAAYWFELSDKYAVSFLNYTIEGPFIYTQGALYFTPGLDTETDITSPAFFNAIKLLKAADTNSKSYISFAPEPLNITTLLSYPWNVSAPQTFWPPADALAKILYSTIMTDLGHEQFKLNIFADENLLHYFTSNISRRNYLEQGNGALMQQLIAQGALDPNITTGPLEVHPSVISSKYLCQVPQPKSTGSRVLSIVVSDLVLLQALWIVTSWVATFFVGRREERANWCEGCIEMHGNQPRLKPERVVTAGRKVPDLESYPRPKDQGEQRGLYQASPGKD